MIRDPGEGVCIFSDIAVADSVLLRRHPAIRCIPFVDLDVHRGIGNAALFDGRHEVQTFSMRCAASCLSTKEQSDLNVGYGWSETCSTTAAVNNMT